MEPFNVTRSVTGFLSREGYQKSLFRYQDRIPEGVLIWGGIRTGFLVKVIRRSPAAHSKWIMVPCDRRMDLINRIAALF